MQASRQGRADIVCLLLAAGVSVEQRISNNVTSFHHAAYEGHADVMKLLVPQISSFSKFLYQEPTEGDWQGKTALYLALEALDDANPDDDARRANAAGRAECAALLSAAMSSYRVKDTRDKLAHQEHDAACLKYNEELKAKGSRYRFPHSSFFGKSVKPGDDRLFHSIAMECDVAKRDYKKLFSLAEEYAGCAAVIAYKDQELFNLTAAATHGLLNIGIEKQCCLLRLLIVAGLNVDLCNDVDHQSLLHQAAEKGHIAAVKLLLAEGASVNIKDKDGRTPLTLAKKTSDIDGMDEARRVCFKLIKDAGGRE